MTMRLIVQYGSRDNQDDWRDEIHVEHNQEKTVVVDTYCYDEDGKHDGGSSVHMDWQQAVELAHMLLGAAKAAEAWEQNHDLQQMLLNIHMNRTA